MDMARGREGQQLVRALNKLQFHPVQVRHGDYSHVLGRASQMAQKESNSAAVASSMAAKIYDLNILAEKIEDLKENITRFFIIGKEIHEPAENSKTTIMFSIKDRVGALHDILIPFKKSGLNLTKIESRPSRIKAWEYVFFVDLEGHLNDPKVKKALEELKKDCVFLNILGSYPAAIDVIRRNYTTKIAE